MRSHFVSRDQLASFIVGEDHYVILLIRDSVPVIMFLSSGKLIDVIRSTLLKDSEDDFIECVKLREKLGIEFIEAERLKECYLSMKEYFGHSL
jgi:hypothetical protein